MNDKMVGRLCKSIVSFPSRNSLGFMYSVGNVMSVATHKWVSGKVCNKSSSKLLLR
jgi:hypothetical protein